MFLCIIMPVPITLVLLTHLHLLQKSRFLLETSSTSTQQRSRNSHSNSFSSSVCIRLPTSNEAAIFTTALITGLSSASLLRDAGSPRRCEPWEEHFCRWICKEKAFCGSYNVLL